MNKIRSIAVGTASLGLLALWSGPASAYYGAPYAQYHQPGYSFSAYPGPYYQPATPYSPHIYQTQDPFRQLLGDQLSLLNSFRYVPGPVHQYFYQYYQPYHYRPWW